jgi:hypothetical protein
MQLFWHENELFWHEYVGYVAMVLGMASLWMRTIIPLRLLAMGACTCMAIYAFVHGAWPAFFLNFVGVPVHAYRAWQMYKLTQRIAVAAHGDLNLDWLKPYMSRRMLPDRAILFRRGDPATEMFYVAAGKLRIAELDIEIGPGQLIGEIGMFSPTHCRTMTVAASGDVELLAISDSSLKQLYYQNPGFGFYLIQVVTRRLVTNLERLEAQVAARRAA